MEIAKNRWEELLYGFFNHRELYFQSEICTEYEEIEYVNGDIYTEHEEGIKINKFYGFIIPGKEVFEYLDNSIKEWELPENTDVVRQFEKEVSLTLSTTSMQLERMQYLYNLNFKFEEVFDRIPTYQKVIKKALNRLLESQADEDFKEFRLVQSFFEILDSVYRIVQKAISVNTRSFEEINQISRKVDNHSVTKLKWLCSDSISAHIITELIDKRYIEAPLTNGDWSYNKTAKICSNLFEFQTSSEEHLKNVFNPERNKLSEIKKRKLSLPDADQVM